MSATGATNQLIGGCPCGCEQVGTKLTVFGHLKGCHCSTCIGRRNQRKGKAAQAKTHRALGGTGFTPSNEESGRPYLVEVSVLPEVKTGQQIPANWARFISSDWFRRALAQSAKSAPFGTGTVPAVVIDGVWLIADLRNHREKLAEATAPTEKGE